jgi:hypothetical protein
MPVWLRSCSTLSHTYWPCWFDFTSFRCQFMFSRYVAKYRSIIVWNSFFVILPVAAWACMHNPLVVTTVTGRLASLLALVQTTLNSYLKGPSCCCEANLKWATGLTRADVFFRTQVTDELFGAVWRKRASVYSEVETVGVTPVTVCLTVPLCYVPGVQHET